MPKTVRHAKISAAYRLEKGSGLKLPVYMSRVPAGFPSPADDFIEKKLSLDEHLIRNKAATFIVRVSGDSMIGAGIHNGDYLIVDRSLEAADKKVVVAVLEGELVVKRIRKKSGKLYLVSENPNYQDLEVGELSDFKVWGVVTFVIHKV